MSESERSERPREFWIRSDEDHAYESVHEALSGEHLKAQYEIIHVIEKSTADKLVEALENIRDIKFGFFQKLERVDQCSVFSSQVFCIVA